jgi:hypothetical protein
MISKPLISHLHGRVARHGMEGMTRHDKEFHVKARHGMSRQGMACHVKANVKERHGMSRKGNDMERKGMEMKGMSRKGKAWNLFEV